MCVQLNIILNYINIYVSWFLAWRFSTGQLGAFKATIWTFLHIQLISSVQFSHSVMSDSLRPHESQHARPPCPSPSPRVHSDSCSSVWNAIQPFHPLSSPSPPASNPSQHQSLFQWVNSLAWGGQSTGVSALASFLPKKSQGWSPSEWTGWTSLQSKGLSRVFSKPQFKSINSSALSLLHSPTLTSIHDHWKNHSLD